MTGHFLAPTWRCLMAEDRALWVGLFSDPETMRHVGVPQSPQQASSGFDRALAVSNGGPYRVLCDRSGAALGIGLLAAPDNALGSVEIGIMLVPPQRGMGLGRRGLALLIAEARARFGQTPISVQYRPAHMATVRMVLSLGFVDRGERTADGLVRALLEEQLSGFPSTPCTE